MTRSPLLVPILVGVALATLAPSPAHADPYLPWNTPAEVTKPPTLAAWATDRAELPQFQELPAVRWDRHTGGARLVVGALSGPDPRPADAVAHDWLSAHDYLFNLGPATGDAFATLVVESGAPRPGEPYLFRARQWVDDVPSHHVLEVLVMEDGTVAVCQGILLDPGGFRSAWALSPQDSEAIAREHAGEPGIAPAKARRKWMQDGDEARPVYGVDLPAWNDPARGWSSGFAAWISAESGQVLAFSSTDAADDSAWQSRGYGPAAAVSNSVEVGAATQVVPAFGGDCGEAVAVGDWLSIYSGEDVDGVWPVASTAQGFVLNPVLSDSCFPGPPGGLPTFDLPYFSQSAGGELDCTDGLDDDGNGQADCYDGGCSGTPSCIFLWSLLGVAEEVDCGDGIDDGTSPGWLQPADGLVDCADPECDEASSCADAADVPGKYVANARRRIADFLQGYYQRYRPDLDYATSPLTVVVERPASRDGSINPSPVGPDRSFTRSSNPWLPDALAPYEPGSWAPADQRWTVMLSRGGSSSADDGDGGRSAGVQFHEASHYWLRAHGGALGAEPWDARSSMAGAFDEGWGYYAASTFLSRPDPLGSDFPDSVNFVATHFPPAPFVLPADEVPQLRYFLTWDKVAPCFNRDPDQCDAFAAYAGPQFIIEPEVNDDFVLLADCGFGTSSEIVTIASTPELVPGMDDVWWTGRDLAAAVEAALQQTTCAGDLAAQSPPGALVAFWEADRGQGPQGLLIGCDGCDWMKGWFGGSGATLGFPATLLDAGPNLEINDPPAALWLEASSSWPTSAYNRDCTDFRSSTGASYGGVADENDVTQNCRIETSNYFFGDLLAQALWDLRWIAPDPEEWESFAIGAASLTRDCTTYDENALNVYDDCPNLYEDFFEFIYLFEWFSHGAAQTELVGDYLAARGLR